MPVWAVSGAGSVVILEGHAIISPTSPMRIDYVSYARLPSRQANTIQVMRMCAAFAARGHQVRLWAVRQSGDEEDLNAYYGVPDTFAIRRLRQLSLPGMRIPSYVVNLWFNLRRGRPADLYYGRDPLAILAAADLGEALIYEAHSPPLGKAQAAALRYLAAHPNFHRLVVISHALAEDYRRLLPGLAPEKMLVAPDGASLYGRSFQASELPRRPGALQAGYSGHLYPGRGIDVLFALAERLPDWDFHIFGGQDEDLQSWRSRGLPVNLTLHGHRLPAEIPGLLAQMDVLLAPYQRKVGVAKGGDTARFMSPLKIFEYMAAGKAILASDLPALREVLVDRQNCLLVDPEDVDDWAEALRKLADDSLRAALGNAAQKQLLAEYTWERRAERVLAGL